MNKRIAALMLIVQLAPQALLFAEGEAGSPQQGFVQTLVMIAIAVLFFYIILWRPEQKRRKAMEEQRKNLKKGDRVTAMGIIGTVDKIEEHSVILKMIDGGKIEVLLAAISDVSSSEEPKLREKESKEQES